MAVSGAGSFLYYGIEKFYNPSSGFKGTFGTPVTTNNGFCIGAKLSSMERNNNLEAVYGLGNPEAQAIVEKQFAGSFSVEGFLSDPWFLIPLFGAYNPSQKTLYPVGGSVSSLTVTNQVVSNKVGATAAVNTFVFTGCVMTNCSISAAVNEIATCKMDFAYVNEAYNSITGHQGQISSQLSMPYTFASGVVNWNNQVLAQVQSCELTINPNRDLIYGLGSRLGVNTIQKNFEYDLNLSLVFEDAHDMLRYFYTGTANGATPVGGGAAGCLVENGITLTFTNCSGGNSMTFTITGVKINTDSLPQNPTELIVENINMKAKTCVATIVSSSATPTLPT